jgi:hypothetical protein
VIIVITRYNSGFCVFRDCENRKYGNTESIVYIKINKKEMIPNIIII